MNAEQVRGLIRQALPLISGAAIALGADAETVGSIEEQALIAGGAVVGLVSIVWSLKSKTDVAIVANAAAVPLVQKIEITPTVAGAELADAVPSPNVVQAGSFNSPLRNRL